MEATKEIIDIKPETQDFSYSYNLDESKKLLWKLFKAAIIPKCNRLNKRELSDLTTFYEKLNKVLDEVYR